METGEGPELLPEGLESWSSAGAGGGQGKRWEGLAEASERTRELGETQGSMAWKPRGDAQRSKKEEVVKSLEKASGGPGEGGQRSQRWLWGHEIVFCGVEGQ